MPRKYVKKRGTCACCSAPVVTGRAGPLPQWCSDRCQLLARHVVDARGCWLWAGSKLPKGYGRISFAGVRSTQAHRRSYEVFVGQIPAGLFVCHRCDTPACINPAHLFLGTAAENNADRDAKGRQVPGGARGERNKSKLTEANVLAIRASHERQITLAARFGVDPSTISQIKTRKRWAWLGGDNR